MRLNRRGLTPLGIIAGGIIAIVAVAVAIAISPYYGIPLLTSTIVVSLSAAGVAAGILVAWRL